MVRTRLSADKLLFSLFLELFLVSAVVGSQESSYTLQVASGWEGVSAHSGVLYQPKGYLGKPEYRLADTEYQIDNQSNPGDLLLHFDGPVQAELGASRLHPSFYSVKKGDVTVQTQIRRLGEGAGLFNKSPNGLVLNVEPGSFFEPGDFRNDFTIEFWIYPFTMRDGESIISWRGASWLGGAPLTQVLSARFYNRRVSWDFGNFFLKFSGTKKSEIIGKNVSLTQRKDSLARTWQHHMVRYNSARNILEYLVDGVPEDVVYLTDTGGEFGDPYRPFVGEASNRELTIGKDLSAAVDELRITPSFVVQPNLARHSEESGYVIFESINFREIGVGSKLLSIDVPFKSPGTSEIRCYYRMSEYPAAPRVDDPAWKAFEPNKTIENAPRGQFLAIKVVLLPDGRGEAFPSFQNIVVRYYPDPPPPAPGGIRITVEDGALTLHWNPVPANDLQGYIIYFGNRPGQYDGTSTTLGMSPINVGMKTEFRIDGLDNGRLYYFSIASYDLSNNPIYGMHLMRSFSKEVSARPAQ